MLQKIQLNINEAIWVRANGRTYGKYNFDLINMKKILLQQEYFPSS